MPINIVLLNGPSGSGKTTVGREASKRLGLNTFCFGFADDLKRATHAAFGMFSVPFDQFEQCKNTPMKEFCGVSPREAYINHSEKYMKPCYGKDVFARMAADKINIHFSGIGDFRHDTTTGLYVLTDCGFDIEVDHFAKRFGGQNCLLLRMRMPGRTFVGDSREYVHPKSMPSFWFDNDGTFEEGVRSLVATINDHFIGAQEHAESA